MFCPNCGTQGNGSFCTNCGTRLDVSQPAAQYPPLNQPYIQTIGGKQIDLNKLIRTYGTGWRKVGAYSYLVSTFGITQQEAKAILDPLYAAHAGEKVSFAEGFAAEVGMRADEEKAEKKRLRELEASGKVYCPKCHSTSVTAQKKGFGAGKAVVGAALAGPTGLLAGTVGAGKVKCTCLKCGHTWKPGK